MSSSQSRSPKSSVPPTRPGLMLPPPALHSNSAASSSQLQPDAHSTNQKKRFNHRGGKKKKKRTRRPSFAASPEGSGMPHTSEMQRGDSLNAARESFYRLQGRNNSNTSLESEALLDHREQQSMRPRRPSTMDPNMFSQSMHNSPYRPSYSNPFQSSESTGRLPRTPKSKQGMGSGDEEREPLLSSISRAKTSASLAGYGANNTQTFEAGLSRDKRRASSQSSLKSRRMPTSDRQDSPFFKQPGEYNVNYPPSVPGSPLLGASHPQMSYGDRMVTDEFTPRMSPRSARGGSRGGEPGESQSMPSSPSRRDPGFESRRHTIALEAEEDVCFPVEELSEMVEDEAPQREDIGNRRSVRRRRGKWPDLSVLDDWSRVEKEGRNEERRAKKITEPHLIGGRLRPIHRGWHRAEDDAPYRFTYFNEEFQSTIHSQTISELVQPGGTFRELFIPDPPLLSDSSDTEDEDDMTYINQINSNNANNNGESKPSTRHASILTDTRSEMRRTSSLNGGEGAAISRETSGEATPNAGVRSPHPRSSPDPKSEKPKRYGERPTWWLDVLSPTDAEMKILSKAFGIHPLTAEDIMMQEAREKVELFRNYYFVNYRTFEQDMNSEDFLEPVNMYVVVFREGLISFHFSLTPHPANVRRRIRQLHDYLILSSDWISYAIIDDITDVFAPLIQNIEDEVDDIDDAILQLHTSPDDRASFNEKQSQSGDSMLGVNGGGDMLRRVGDCRKKVMGLYRLLGNKADVIKGFAKRCNEHWEVAPRSEIGLYLGDIQDHIVTMTSNLSHYEKILARAHGNYLAQINIRMNERQEQTADVLGKLTVLGTIVLPMNIITGLWGMNVWVPGQDYEGDLTWFWCITAGLLFFGASCYYIAKIFYRIV
ncbi:hypothetical protein F5884DRAFT_154722 [Xylogone sp. PMI_703]|nr:hypothetical protein F5884DRAFT_154722 [Xylogone sp. PMI_703]